MTLHLPYVMTNSGILCDFMGCFTPLIRNDFWGDFVGFYFLVLKYQKRVFLNQNQDTIIGNG